MGETRKKTLGLIGKTIVYSFAGFGVIFILILVGVLSLMSPKTKLSKIPNAAVLNLNFALSYAEVRQDDFFAEFTNQSVYSIFDLIRAINVAATDDRIKALSADLNVTSLSLAQIQDIAEALTYFKSKGKKTYVFSNGLGSFGQGSKEYALASLFDEIWLQPHSDIGMTGVSIEVPFFKNILKKIGVEPEFYMRYEYKTAVASLLNADFTPTYKKELEGLAGGLYAQLTEMMSYGRNMHPNDIEQATDQAPIFAQKALEIGLVDKLGYRYELNKTLSEKYEATIYDMSNYMAHIQDRDDSDLPQIALLVLEGMIETGESSNTPLKDAIIGSSTVLKQIDEIKKQENLKALVLRINSPGGSYVASDEIRAALVGLKNEKNIPIVVSMSTYAASGGYFVSLAGDYIFSDPATITGSIGVLGGKFVVSDLMQKLDINWENIKFGKNAGILSFNHKFSDSERAVFESSLDDIYQDFTAKVSESRKIDADKMDQIARGRVWLGKSALSVRLVDELGGMQRAILKAKEMAEIGSDENFSLQYYPHRETLQEKLTKFIETGGNLPSIKVLGDLNEFKILYRLNYNTALLPFYVKM